MDALYILSPQSYIVDCLLADFERRRYKKSWLVWTSGRLSCVLSTGVSVLTAYTVLDKQQRDRLERSQMSQEQIASFRVMTTDYFPRESRLVTFRDPWSFPILFNPACNRLVPDHLSDLAEKVSAYGACMPQQVTDS
jgi:syntaxin-binding protein 1